MPPFRYGANGRQLTLLSETPTVEFGKSHPLVPEKPLNGQKDAKVTHWNGGNVHIFSFNHLPEEKK
jgi:hypothetical protein